MIYKWYTSTDNWASIFYQSPICFRTFEQKNKCGYLQNLHWFTSCILNDNSPVEGCSPAGWKTIQNGHRNWSKVQEPSEADPYVSVSNIPKKVYCREIQVVGSSSISGLLSLKCQFLFFFARNCWWTTRTWKSWSLSSRVCSLFRPWFSFPASIFVGGVEWVQKGIERCWND